jgi:hypothetical protein
MCLIILSFRKNVPVWGNKKFKARGVIPELQPCRHG